MTGSGSSPLDLESARKIFADTSGLINLPKDATLTTPNGVAANVLEGVGNAAAGAVAGPINMAGSVSGLVGSAYGVDISFKAPWDTPEMNQSVVYGLSKGVTQFLSAFIPVAGALGRAGMAAGAARSFAAGAITDFAAFDGHDERLSNLLIQFDNPILNNTVTRFLAAKGDDGMLEGRLKNLLEGGAIGLGTEAAAHMFISGLKALKLFRAGKTAEAAAEAAKSLSAPEAKQTAKEGATLSIGGKRVFVEGKPTDIAAVVKGIDGVEVMSESAPATAKAADGAAAERFIGRPNAAPTAAILSAPDREADAMFRGISEQHDRFGQHLDGLVQSGGIGSDGAAFLRGVFSESNMKFYPAVEGIVHDRSLDGGALKRSRTGMKLVLGDPGVDSEALIVMHEMAHAAIRSAPEEVQAYITNLYNALESTGQLEKYFGKTTGGDKLVTGYFKSHPDEFFAEMTAHMLTMKGGSKAVESNDPLFIRVVSAVIRKMRAMVDRIMSAGVAVETGRMKRFQELSNYVMGFSDELPQPLLAADKAFAKDPHGQYAKMLQQWNDLSKTADEWVNAIERRNQTGSFDGQTIAARPGVADSEVIGSINAEALFEAVRLAKEGGSDVNIAETLSTFINYNRMATPELDKTVLNLVQRAVDPEAAKAGIIKPLTFDEIRQTASALAGDSEAIAKAVTESGDARSLASKIVALKILTFSKVNAAVQALQVGGLDTKEKVIGYLSDALSTLLPEQRLQHGAAAATAAGRIEVSAAELKPFLKEAAEVGKQADAVASTLGIELPTAAADGTAIGEASAVSTKVAALQEAADRATAQLNPADAAGAAKVNAAVEEIKTLQAKADDLSQRATGLAQSAAETHAKPADVQINPVNPGKTLPPTLQAMVDAQPEQVRPQIQTVYENLWDLARKGESLEGDKADQVIGAIVESIRNNPKAGTKIAEKLMHRHPKFSKIMEFWMNAVLSGPKTFLTNLVQASAVFTSPLELAAGGDVKHAYNLFISTVAEAADLFKAAKSSERAGNIADAVRRSFQMEGPVLDSAPFEGVTTGAISAKGFGLDAGSTAGKLADKAGKVIRLPWRIMGSSDEFFKQLHYRSYLRMAGMDDPRYVKLLQSGNTAGAASFLEQFVERGFREEGRAALDEFGKPLFMDALHHARDLTFQQGFGTDALSMIGKGVESAIQAAPPLRIIFPFVKTPTNILRKAWRLTPGLNLLMGEYRARFMSPDPFVRAQARGEMVVGSAATTLFAWAAMTGKITGSGPVDRRERDILLATGWQPLSLVFEGQDGKKEYFSLSRIEPFNTILGLVADTVETANKAMQVGDEPAMQQIGDLSMAAAGIVARNITNKTWLVGLNSIVDALQDPERNSAKYINSLAGSFIPALVASANPDPYTREATTMLEKIRSRLPGLSEGVRPRRNLFGEPVPSPMLNRLQPFAYSQGLSDPAREEMAKLQFGFGPPARRLDGIDLSAVTNDKGQDAWDRYQELHGEVKAGGKTLAQALDKLVGSPTYAALPMPNGVQDQDNPRIKAIQQTITGYRQAALGQLLREYPQINKLRAQVKRTAITGQLPPSSSDRAAVERLIKLGK